MNDESFAYWRRVAQGLLMSLLVLLASVASAQGELDLDKAVKIGNGKIMVIQFTDPDCSFCRKAEDYFQNRTDVTRYVFFLPLRIHREAKAKVQYILSAKDKAQAFREAGSDKFDKKKLVQVTPEGIKLQKEHEQIARASKMDVTPTFIVYGRIVEGFDLKKLEPLLK